MVVDKLDHWRGHAVLPRLTYAFELLEKADTLALPDGRYELCDERIIALPQSYTTKPIEEGRLEAHRRYIDIQYIVEGEERMGWAPLEDQPGSFDEEKDLGFYEGEAEMVTVKQGSFAIFYPWDAHMPCIHPVKGPTQVRKIVMKVLVE